MFRLRDACLAVLVTAACSPVLDPSNVPDAAIDAAPTTPPMIVSSNPANMQKQVSVLQPITLFFDRRLDPETVTAATVRLRYSWGYGWYNAYGAAAYDDLGFKVTFVPKQPMMVSARYELVINGVKDLVGNSLDNHRVRFNTYVNANTRYANFSNNGAINSAAVYELDMNGYQRRGLSRNNPGGDGIWFTSDDPILCCPYNSIYSDDGRQTEGRGYNNVGGDGKAGTMDDVLSSLQKITYDPGHGQMTDATSYAAGPDTVLGTADDVISGYSRYYYNADGYWTGYAGFNNPGVDNTWKTSDDKGSSWGEIILDANGNQTRQISRQNGPDGLPRTPDDVINGVYDTEYDTNSYYAVRNISRTIGPDNMWLTADDGISYVSRNILDTNGLQIEYLGYSAPGPDTMWLTADDVVDYRQTVEYGPTKQQTGYTSYNAPGVDTMWGTADDVISSYSKTTYDSNGNQTDQKAFAAGVDGVFKTADDRVTYDYDFETAK